MKVKTTTLDIAQETFEAQPSNLTAAVYMGELMEYEADGMIGDDTWLDGLSSIRDYLAKTKEKSQ